MNLEKKIWILFIPIVLNTACVQSSWTEEFSHKQFNGLLHENLTRTMPHLQAITDASAQLQKNCKSITASAHVINNAAHSLTLKNPTKRTRMISSSIGVVSSQNHANAAHVNAIINSVHAAHGAMNTALQSFTEFPTNSFSRSWRIRKINTALSNAQQALSTLLASAHHAQQNNEAINANASEINQHVSAIGDVKNIAQAFGFQQHKRQLEHAVPILCENNHLFNSSDNNKQLIASIILNTQTALNNVNIALASTSFSD